MPSDWHGALVTAILKKGDPSKCENYKPISLLPVGYKLFATILLQRLKTGGAEQRVWRTQYGFKSDNGTADDLFLARRLLEKTWANKSGQLLFLALDWAKAFDSVSPEALLTALKRFGVPDQFAAVVRAIYTDSCFAARDAGQTSSQHTQ